MKDAIAMLIACKDSKVVDELQRALGIGEKDQETLDAPLSDGATKRECERGARKAGEVQGRRVGWLLEACEEILHTSSSPTEATLDGIESLSHAVIVNK